MTARDDWPALVDEYEVHRPALVDEYEAHADDQDRQVPDPTAGVDEPRHCPSLRRERTTIDRATP
ncbi:MAG: hypothetical protein L0Z49_10175, partial [Actinobacteria bacterium]|nr:hypothetical protein [Actinomycetota bacterium]